MKLFPKNVKVCTVCPPKELTLKSASRIIINMEEKEETKVSSLINTRTRKVFKKGLF